MKFTYYTIIGKDVDMIHGHLCNVKEHAGFDRLTCEKELIVVVYVNDKIPPNVTQEILSVCKQQNATIIIYNEPIDNFLENLYACWNLGYENASDGFVFRAGSDQAFNRDSFLKLYEIAIKTKEKNEKMLLNANTIEHSVRAMSQGNVSRHILADFGDSFRNFDVERFEVFCKKINRGVDKKLLTIDKCVSIWGKPTPFLSSLGKINRTEGCSWLITKKDWETYGPLPTIRDGVTGDCWMHDRLQIAGYKDYMVRDCITYHFFRGECYSRYQK